MRGELVSCLVLGHKRSGAIFNPEDFEVLEALARQSALVVKNIELVDEVHVQKRLAEFGELMAAINHEFNNVFAIIGGTIQQLIENPNDPSLKQHLASLQEEILRGQYIIRAASAYRKKHKTPLQSWSLAKIVAETIAQSQQDGFAEAKSQLTITATVPENLEVTGQTTIPELISNSLRCLGWACERRTGTLHIEAAMEASLIQMRFVMTGGEDLRAIIKKEGALAPEPGRHGGLYYFLVKLIVSDHRGDLVIESTPGGGTTVVVRLPQDQPATVSAPEAVGPAV
jgi:signal transduction histidine kinase